MKKTKVISKATFIKFVFCRRRKIKLHVTIVIHYTECFGLVREIHCFIRFVQLKLESFSYFFQFKEVERYIFG